MYLLLLNCLKYGLFLNAFIYNISQPIRSVALEAADHLFTYNSETIGVP